MLKNPIVLGLIGLVMAGLIWWQLGRTPETEPAPPAARGGSYTLSTPTVEPEPAPTDTLESPEGVDLRGAEKVARKAITAYTTFAYTDPAADTWRQRLNEYTTEGFQHMFAETFGDEDEGYWQREFVEPHREQTIEISNIQVAELEAKPTQDQVTLVAVYRSKMRNDSTGGEWVIGEPQSQYLDIERQDDGSWLVADIRDATPMS